jgi:hypothetical protein
MQVVIHRISWGVVLAGTLGCAAGASGQIVCDQPGVDAAIGAMPAPSNYASAGGIEAFAIGASICNVGTEPLAIIASPSNQHPVFAQQLYRLKTVDGAARFEQIGMSWTLHLFAVLQQTLCCQNCVPSDSQHLGVRCSCPEPSSIAGAQSFLAPRWQVNASTGLAIQPVANPPFAGTIDRRLQAKISDFDPALNAGAQYFAEIAIVAPDDASDGNGHNNASYRPCTFSGTGSVWSMALGGSIVGGLPAIRAWHASDASVVESFVDIPGDGRFILAAKATPLPGKTWRYEYALYNLNSDRSARSFAVPLPANATITNIGFHDVDYHSGDGINNVTTDGADWQVTQTNNAITWNTQTFAENLNANALRWGTLYNFRFDADVAPAGDLQSLTIGTFKINGSASAMSIAPAPADVDCISDIAAGGNGVVDVDDLLEVINSWGDCAIGKPCEADIAPEGGNSIVDVDDLLVVINAWGPCF